MAGCWGSFLSRLRVRRTQGRETTASPDQNNGRGELPPGREPFSLSPSRGCQGSGAQAPFQPASHVGSAGGGAWDCRGGFPFSPQGCAHPGSNSALPAKRGRGEKNRRGLSRREGKAAKGGRHSETIPNVKRGAVACVKGRTTADTGGGGTGTGYPGGPRSALWREPATFAREIRGRDRRPSLPRAQDGAQTPKRHHTPPDVRTGRKEQSSKGQKGKQQGERRNGEGGKRCGHGCPPIVVGAVPQPTRPQTGPPPAPRPGRGRPPHAPPPTPRAACSGRLRTRGGPAPALPRSSPAQHARQGPTRPRGRGRSAPGPGKAAPPTAPAARPPQSLPRFRGREPERQGLPHGGGGHARCRLRPRPERAQGAGEPKPPARGLSARALSQHDRKQGPLLRHAQGEDALRTPHHPRPGKRLTFSRGGLLGPAPDPRGTRARLAAFQPSPARSAGGGRGPRVDHPVVVGAGRLSPHDRGAGALSARALSQHDRKQGPLLRHAQGEDALRTPHHPRPGKRLTFSRGGLLGPAPDPRGTRARLAAFQPSPARSAGAHTTAGQGPFGPRGQGRQPLRRPRQPGLPQSLPAFGDGSRRGRGFLTAAGGTPAAASAPGPRGRRGQESPSRPPGG
ncbi:hypothetical protein C7M84_018143 [Penaeus vannamei]|uniref:Uncharacterized protein n=1 Tax=Penaeus vannamei TaxID=6689 RepID=A0A423SIG9_PENVA|nr:hypothetical protein C7M84_018143 [Penaeus vannamei]